MAKNVRLLQDGNEVFFMEKMTNNTRAEVLNRKRDGAMEKRCVISRVVQEDGDEQLKEFQEASNLTVELISPLNGAKITFNVADVEEYKLMLNPDGTVLLEMITFSGKVT